MAVSQRLDLRPSQSLVMTPQLQQAIKLLQFSNLELSAYVAEELERNPLLERDERAEADDRDDTQTAPGTESRRGDEDDLDDRRGDADWQDAPDAFSDAPPMPDRGGSFSGDASEMGGMEQRLAGERSLRDHLLAQAHLTFARADERAIAETLIDSLDEAGYLGTPAADLATFLGVPETDVDAVLDRMQGFEPTGVFARDLAECLAIQLRERNRLDPAMQALLANLELVARRDYAGLRRVCGVDGEDVADMLVELRALDPRPAAAFDGAPVQPLIPDILMRATRDGSWQVEMNLATLPRVLVNNSYYARISADTRDKGARSYLSERLQAANWLARALDQRAQTILKVASAIVARQRAFFSHGVQHLKPLTLREIAGTIEMHESTVSRVTTNKYIATPRGTYELKYFFTASITGADGESHSAEAVRDRIKKLIDAEPPQKVLSDDRIVAILRGEGVDIARRTVAKYREALRIPSSVQRKREKATPA